VIEEAPNPHVPVPQVLLPHPAMIYL